MGTGSTTGQREGGHGKTGTSCPQRQRQRLGTHTAATPSVGVSGSAVTGKAWWTWAMRPLGSFSN